MFVLGQTWANTYHNSLPTGPSGGRVGTEANLAGTSIGATAFCALPGHRSRYSRYYVGFHMALLAVPTLDKVLIPCPCPTRFILCGAHEPLPMLPPPRRFAISGLVFPGFQGLNMSLLASPYLLKPSRKAIIPPSKA